MITRRLTMKEKRTVVALVVWLKEDQRGGDLEKDLVGRYDPGSGFALVWGGFTYSDGEYSLHLGAHI